MLLFYIFLGVIMRLDKFLKISRIIKRRTVAKEVCDKSKIFVNSKLAKASTDVKINDIIELHFGENVIKYKILKISENVKKEEANTLVELL